MEELAIVPQRASRRKGWRTHGRCALYRGFCGAVRHDAELLSLQRA